MGLFDKIFGKVSISSEDNQYLDKLINWAKENDLPTLKIEKHIAIPGGHRHGIPRDKKALFNLHTLNLQDCELSELPKEIGKLTNLKKLWLEGNNLTFLPDEICSLTQLEELYIPNNNIEILPENIGNLRALKEINFRNNNIKYLPVSMVLLKKLLKINFSSQKHGKKVSTPNVASKILYGEFDDNVAFRESMTCSNESEWNNLKEQLRNKPMANITVGVNKIPFLSIIADLYGEEIAGSQDTSLFFEIGRF